MNDIKQTEIIEHIIGVIAGVAVLLVAFKVYNPFKGNPEKETAFYNKYGLAMKLIGLGIAGSSLAGLVL